MADDFVRVEIGFEGGQILSWLVTSDTVVEPDLVVADIARVDPEEVVDSEEGTITIVLARVVYVKRHARESRVGFAG